MLAKFTREDGYSETYSYNANRLLSTVTTSEDLTTTLTWDILYGDGVVISADQNGERTNYTYGLERISAISGSTRTEYVYDGRGSVAAEVSYNNAWYTFGGGLARKNVTAKSYTPFGEQIGETVSGFGYNGEYYNAATGMIYLRARFYAPEMNRFGQKDLVRGSIVDPLGLNRYPYCANDPINFCDPSGMALVRNNMVMVNDGGGGSFRNSLTYEGYLTEGQRLANEAKQSMRQAFASWQEAEAYAPGSKAANAAMDAWKQAKASASSASTNLSKLQSAGSLSAASTYIANIRSAASTARNAANEARTCADRTARNTRSHSDAQPGSQFRSDDGFSGRSGSFGTMPNNTTTATPSVTLWSNIEQFCSNVFSTKITLEDMAEADLRLAEAKANVLLGFVSKVVDDALDIGGIFAKGISYITKQRIDTSAANKEWEDFVSQYVTNPYSYEIGKLLESATTLYLGAKATVEGLQGLASINWNGVLEALKAGSSFNLAPVLVEGGMDAFGAASAAELLKTALPSLAKLFGGYAFAKMGGEGVANSATGNESKSITRSEHAETRTSERTYKHSPKHDVQSGWGSPDPIPDEATGQQLLDTAYSSSKTKQLYNIYDGQIIKFQPDGVSGEWHAYVVENTAKEVPVDVLREMLNDGLISRSDYLKFIKNK